MRKCNICGGPIDEGEHHYSTTHCIQVLKGRIEALEAALARQVPPTPSIYPPQG